MDVTFAGNSNEVTPWCKIEFNYRNDFDNYTRWKLREVIKVVVYLYNFFLSCLHDIKVRIACQSIMGFFEKTKLLFRKKNFRSFFTDVLSGWNSLGSDGSCYPVSTQKWVEHKITEGFFCLICIPTCWSFNSPSHYYQNLENLIDLGHLSNIHH